MTILLIEDDLDHQALFQRNVRKSSQQWVRKLDVVDSFAKARVHLEKELPDAIVLDLTLPDSPLEKTLSSGIRELSDFPIVVLTSLEDVELGERAINAGAQDYLSKSQVTPPLLRQTIRFAKERHHNKIQLAQRNRDLQAFAHTLAHELRNPLQTVSIALDHFSEKTTDDPVDQQLLELATDSTERMVGIIQGFLSYAKSGDLGHYEKLDLAETVQTLVSKLELNHEENLQLTLAQDLPTVFAPRTLFLQVLDNLLRNSIRYRHPERAIAIEVFNADSPAGFVRVGVRDNGQGISQPDQKQIFQPFYRGTTSYVTEGFGIGLSLCQRVIESMGGTIHVTSKPGLETTFFLTVPEKAPQNHTESLAKSEKAATVTGD